MLEKFKSFTLLLEPVKITPIGLNLETHYFTMKLRKLYDEDKAPEAEKILLELLSKIEYTNKILLCILDKIKGDLACHNYDISKLLAFIKTKIDEVQSRDSSNKSLKSLLENMVNKITVNTGLEKSLLEELVEEIENNIIPFIDRETSADKRATPHTVKSGIKHMFSIITRNEHTHSAPYNENERKELYKELANGFMYMAKSMKEKYESGKMNSQELYYFLEQIGDSGFSCAYEWKSVLITLFESIDTDLLGKRSTTQKNDKLLIFIKNIVLKQKTLVSSRLSEQFINTYYQNVDLSSRVNYRLFFEKYLSFTYNLDIIMSTDISSFFPYNYDELQLLKKNADEFLYAVDINDMILQEVEHEISESIQSDEEFKREFEKWTHVIWSNFKKKDRKSIGNIVAFTDKYVFGKGIIQREELLSTFVISPLALNILLRDKGIIETDLDKKDFIRLRIIFDKKLPLQERLNLLKLIIDKKGVAFKYRGGRSLLEECALYGFTEGCQLLIENGADNEDCNSSLYCAIENGHIKTFLKLIELGGNKDTKDKNGCTPLHYALLKGSIKITTKLIELDANKNAKDSSGKTPLHYAVLKSPSSIMEKLISLGASSEIKNDSGKSYIDLAVEKACTDIIMELIESGASKNATDNFGKTPLHYAAENGHTEAAAKLIELDANTDIKDNSDKTPLHYAAKNGHTETAAKLILLGAIITPDISKLLNKEVINKLLDIMQLEDMVFQQQYESITKKSDMKYVEFITQIKKYISDTDLSSNQIRSILLRIQNILNNPVKKMIADIKKEPSFLKIDEKTQGKICELKINYPLEYRDPDSIPDSIEKIFSCLDVLDKCFNDKYYLGEWSRSDDNYVHIKDVMAQLHEIQYEDIKLCPSSSRKREYPFDENSKLKNTRLYNVSVQGYVSPRSKKPIDFVDMYDEFTDSEELEYFLDF